MMLFMDLTQTDLIRNYITNWGHAAGAAPPAVPSERAEPLGVSGRVAGPDFTHTHTHTPGGVTGAQSVVKNMPTMQETLV